MNKLEQMLLLKAIKESNLMPQTKSFMDVVLKNWKNANPAGSAKVSAPSAPPEIESIEPSEFDSVDQISSPEPVAVSSPEVASGTSRIADQLRSAGGEGGTAMPEAEGVQTEPVTPKVEPFKTPREKESALGDIYKRRAYLQHLIMSKRGSTQGSMLSPEQEAEFERFFPGVSPYGTSPQKLQALYDQLEPQIAELQARPVQGGLRGAMARIGQFVNPPTGLRPFSSEEEALRYVSGNYLDGSESAVEGATSGVGFSAQEEQAVPDELSQAMDRRNERRDRIETLKVQANKKRNSSKNPLVREWREHVDAMEDEEVQTIGNRRSDLQEMVYGFDPATLEKRGGTRKNPYVFEIAEDKDRAMLMAEDYQESLQREQSKILKQLAELRRAREQEDPTGRYSQRLYPEEVALEEEAKKLKQRAQVHQRRILMIENAKVRESY